ncbi:MAG: FG-GAP repeat domain-containing protein [Planctomycetaceae bacterium]
MSARQGFLFIAFIATVAIAAAVCLLWRTSTGEGDAGPSDRDDHAARVKAAELAPDRQKEIWTAEHATFELERRFGRAFVNAIVRRDRKQVAGFFREHFKGTVLAGPFRERNKGQLSEQRRSKTTHDSNSFKAGAVVDALLERTGSLRRVERNGLRVLAIEQLDGTPGRWRTRLLLTYAGSGERSQFVELKSEHRVEFTIANERQLDRAATIDRWEVLSEKIRSARTSLMEEVTSSWGLKELPIPDNWELPRQQIVPYRFQMATADYDRDGDLDLAVSVNLSSNAAPERGGAPILLESDGGRFRDVARAKGLTAWSDGNSQRHFLCGWFDYDGDGWPDLLMGKRLYHNDSGKRFTDVTAGSGLRIDPECMGCAIADFDCDGRLDLYLIYSEPAPGSDLPNRFQWVDENDAGEFNRLWRNLGNGRFEDVTHKAGVAGGKRHTHAAAWFFCDDDRFPDLYLANDFGKNVVLRNRGDGTFEDVSNASRASDFATSMGVVAGDLNNDGRSDIYVANMYSKMGRRIIGQVCEADYPDGLFRQLQGSCAGNRLYLRQPDGLAYREVSERSGVNGVGWAYAPAVVDFDGDGRLDLYATTGFMSFDRKEPDG